MVRMVCIGVIVTETPSGENIARRQHQKNGEWHWQGIRITISLDTDFPCGGHQGPQDQSDNFE